MFLRRTGLSPRPQPSLGPFWGTHQHFVGFFHHKAPIGARRRANSCRPGHGGRASAAQLVQDLQGHRHLKKKEARAVPRRSAQWKGIRCFPVYLGNTVFSVVFPMDLLTNPHIVFAPIPLLTPSNWGWKARNGRSETSQTTIGNSVPASNSLPWPKEV